MMLLRSLLVPLLLAPLSMVGSATAPPPRPQPALRLLLIGPARATAADPTSLEHLGRLDRSERGLLTALGVAGKRGERWLGEGRRLRLIGASGQDLQVREAAGPVSALAVDSGAGELWSVEGKVVARRDLVAGSVLGEWTLERAPFEPLLAVSAYGGPVWLVDSGSVALLVGDSAPRWLEGLTRVHDLEVDGYGAGWALSAGTLVRLLPEGGWFAYPLPAELRGRTWRDLVVRSGVLWLTDGGALVRLDTDRGDYVLRTGLSGVDRIALSLDDSSPPRIGWTLPHEAPSAGSKVIVRLRVDEEGAGVASTDVRLRINGETAEAACRVPRVGEITCEVRAAYVRGRMVLEARLEDRAGNLSNRLRGQWVRSVDSPLGTATEAVLEASADAYLRLEQPTTNFGSSGTMKVQWAGIHRPMVRFELGAVAEDVEQLEAAWLELYLVENGDNWGPGRLVDVHRLTVPWTEGGATWLCADDSAPSNPLPDCWPWWWGGDYAPEPTDSVLHTDGLGGWVAFDVTADVASALAGAASHGWLVKRWIDGPGWARYATREHAYDYAPRLRLIYTPVEESDETPPTIAFASPADGAYLAEAQPTLEIEFADAGSGVDTDSLTLTVAGVVTPVSCSATATQATCGLLAPLPEGWSVLEATVADQSGNVSTPAQVTVHVDTVAPAAVDLRRTTAGFPEAGVSVIVGQAGAAEPFALVTAVHGGTGSTASDAVAGDGSFSLAVAAGGGDIVGLTVTDAVGHASPEAQVVIPIAGGCASPPDPDWIADRVPLLNYDVFEHNRFLWEGEPTVQPGVEPGVLDASSIAVLRGGVLDTDGQPLPAVSISVLGDPSFGCTATRIDGRFDFAVRGGTIVLVFERPGYFTVQRRLDLVYRQQVELEPVVLTSIPEAAPPVVLGAAEAQLARGAVESDSDGDRQATILVPEGVTAVLEMPDGSTQPVDQLTLAIKEYTVGELGPAAMPGTLPPASGYTYAVDIHAEEADAAGARSVVFDRPVYHYTENFLGFPVGAPVPSGSYDSAQGVWVAENDGLVVAVLAPDADGLAEIDVDGSGSPADPATLAELGFTPGERRRLAETYTAGQELWRHPLPHLSEWDFNASFGLLFGSIAPSPLTEASGTEDCNEQEGGSIIECQSQVLREAVPIAGTPFGLHYSSERTPGRLVGRSIDIQLTPAEIPDFILFVVLEVEVAGRHYRYEFPSIPNLQFTFVWDGLDAHGRQVVGDVTARGRVGFVYQPVYLGADSSNDQNFGVPGNAAFTIGPARQPFTLWKGFTATLSALNFGQAGGALGLGLPGWSITPQHVHSSHARRTGGLYFGDGSSRPSTLLGTGDTRLVRSNANVWVWEDGAWVIRNRGFAGVEGILVDDEGNLYFTSGSLYKRTPEGEIYEIAGGGSSISEGVPAVESDLSRPKRLALGPDGALYIAEYNRDRVRRILPDGTIETVLTMEAAPLDVSIGPDGLLYVATGSLPGKGYTIQRVHPETGVAVTFAGGNPSLCSVSGRGDGGMAPDACLILDGNGTHVDWLPDGSLLIPEGTSGNTSKIRRVSPFGQITTFMGEGFPGDPIYGTHYSNSRLRYPSRVAVDPVSGFIAIADGSVVLGAGRLSFIEEDGILSRGNAPSVKDFAYGPDGKFYWVQDPLHTASAQYVRELDRYSAADGDFQVPSPDGGEVYTFTARGRHRETIDAHTGDLVYRFHYDGDDNLSAIEDRYGLQVTLQRDATGRPVSITSPFGQVTTLTVDAEDRLVAVTNPAGETFAMTYAEGVLLESFADPRGNASVFAYDDVGRLLSNTDAKGGFKTLARSPGLEDYTVTLATAEGRTTVFAVHRNPGGSQDRTRTDSGGIVTTTFLKANRGRTETSPDGTVVDLEIGADPRFGAQVVVPESLVVSTPGGLTRTATTERSVTLIDPDGSARDPANLETLEQVLTVNGKQFASTFTAATRTWRFTSAEGRTVTTVVNAQGEVESVHSPGLEPVFMTYDDQGRLIETRSGTGDEERVATLGYAAAGWLDSTVDPEARAFAWQHDPVGRPLVTEYPDGRQLATHFDDNGNVVALDLPERPAHEFAYDEVDLQTTYQPPGGSPETSAHNLDRQPIRLTRPSGEVLDFHYDGTRRLTLLDTPSDDHTFEYVPGAHQVQSVSHWPDGHGVGTPQVVAYSYDGFLPTSTAWSGEVTGVVTHAYDHDFRVVSQSINGGAAVGFSYDQDSLLTQAGALSIDRDAATGWIQATTLGGVETAQSYNGFGEMDSFEATVGGTPVFAATYVRDRLGRITRKTETIEGGSAVYDYTYDAGGRLVRADKDGALLGAYTYDANDNRLTYDGTFGPAIGTYDAQDRLLTYGDVDYTFDADGYLTTKNADGVVTTYDYDAVGSLRRVVLPTGVTVEYTVDGQNRRVGKTIDGVNVQGFLYQDQLNPIAELDGDGNLVSRFVYGTRGHVPDYIQKGGATYRVVSDHLGSVRLVVDTATGAIAHRLDYDSFGRILYDSNPGFQPFGYAGGLYEPQTGLVRFGARDYDPQIGRWTAKDPLNFGGGDTNLYGYALQDPVNMVDPGGEFAIIAGAAIVAGGVWAVAEFAASAYDAYDLGRTVLDPCSSAIDIVLSAGGFAAGLFLPGGGYGVLSKTALRLPRGVRALARANISASGVTVLGSYPGYLAKAKRIGASYFDIGATWRRLTPAQRAAANRVFLDQIADNGDRVLLSVPKGDIDSASWLAREVVYLTKHKGYRWVNQWALAPR